MILQLNYIEILNKDILYEFNLFKISFTGPGYINL